MALVIAAASPSFAQVQEKPTELCGVTVTGTVMLWTRFDPTETIGAAVGTIHQGRRFSATDNLVSMPGYTRVDGAIYFRVAPELDLQLNVENIFNKRYFLYAHRNTNHTPGSPTAFKVGRNARF